MMLLPAITEATNFCGAFFCIKALSGTIYIPPIKAKANKQISIKKPRGSNKNPDIPKGSLGAIKPTDNKYTAKEHTLSPTALIGT